ncbi:MAG: hemerythrin domain-containing protein [Dehalococcoidia bacterium]
MTKQGLPSTATEASERPTEPIRDEHRELLPHIDELRALGEAAEPGSQELGDRLGAAVEFLQGHLLVHAQAEDQVLYPAVARLMGAPQATATMSHDHAAVARLISELTTLKHTIGARAATPAELASLRRLAFGLYALITVHFAKEEEVYLPLLDTHLTSEAASDLYAEMERAAAKIRQAQ